MPVVGVLTVDLIANTATFTADLGKAGNSLDGFGKDAENAGKRAEFSMHGAKAGMALFGEEVGIHVPRHLRALIAEIPGIGAAFATLLPIIGAVFAVKMIVEWVEAQEKAAHELREAWAKFGTDTQKVFNSLDDKLLSAGIKADELAGDHLAALKKQLELINHQSLSELAQQFGVIARASDAVFSHLKSSWHEIGSGSAGAAHALEEFKNEYESLLAQGKDKEAGDLLSGTLKSAAKILDLQTLATQTGKGAGGAANIEAINKLQEQGIGFTEKEIQAQTRLVQALSAQFIVQEKVSAIAQADKGNDETKAAKAAADARKKDHDDFVKLQEKIKQEVTKNRLELKAEVEKGADDTGRIMAFRLTSGLQAEIKAGEARVQAAKEAEKKLLAVARDQATNLNSIDEFIARNEKRKAEQIKAAEQGIQMAIAQTALRSIMANQSLGQSFAQLGMQLAQSMIENLLMAQITGDKEKLIHAKSAAHKTYDTVSGWPVVGPFLAPPMAVAAFAGVMAFEQGGEIPGSGAVPIMGHGGETVVTKALTDQVKGNVGGGSGRGHITIHMPPIQALDHHGVDRVLKKHATLISRHVTAELRKQNRRG
jgi:hypothetical protein